MKSLINIVLAALAITRVACQLTIKDTVVEDDHAKLDAVMAIATDETYFGYFYDNSTVSIKIHDAETHDIIAQDTFKGNGKAVDYLLQTPEIKQADLSADGAAANTMSRQARCPSPPKKRAEDIFEKRASRCYQFCARGSSCTADRRCRKCRYVGGLCRWQLWCVP